MGLARTFQISSLFPLLSVAENVALALAARLGTDRRFWGSVRARPEIVDGAAALLESLGLLALAPQPVADLPYGQRRLVEIALVLALEPKTLLLDEPAAGLAASDRFALLDLLLRLPAALTILVIEHDMSLVFRLAAAHHRAGRGRGSGRGHARRNPRRPPRARRLSRDPLAWLSCCGSRT